MVIDEKFQADDIEKGFYKCPWCNKTFRRWSDLQVHMVDHLDEEIEKDKVKTEG